ncbi:hypothetical protein YASMINEVIRUS_912 [Yasminevirus sp. GU-2018]|uniref:Uncharacterized protein n=1 Tax=Yasminevirus sp. GU-2018 TaxID=2420051 RepID=A0A5K0U8I7_9VIRU|nr:hypothetical protein YASMINEVIRUS_912 [Yasminevirus sp. GU-2018]
MSSFPTLSDIIVKVKDHLINRSKIFESRFYTKCKEQFESIEGIDSLISDRELTTKYFMEPFRMYLLDNFDKFNFFVVDVSTLETSNLLNMCKKLGEDVFFRDVRPMCNHKRVINNLTKQLSMLEHIAEDFHKHPIESDLRNYTAKEVPQVYNSLKDIILIVSIRDLSKDLARDGMTFVKLKSKHSMNVCLSTYTFKFLRYQDIDRFIDYTKSSSTDIVKSVSMFDTVRKFFMKLADTDIDTYSRLLLFSGFVLHSLGTTYTSDADMLYITRGQSESHVSSFVTMLNSFQKIEVFTYSEKSPNIEYISDITTDPDKHFYFLGMKVMNIKKHAKRLYQRATPSSFVDLIMLDRVNNFKVNGVVVKPCIPVITVDEDVVIVYDRKMVQKKLRITQKYLKEWHSIQYTIPELTQMIQRCQAYPNDQPFFRHIRVDPVTIVIDSIIHYTTLNLMNERFDRTVVEPFNVSNLLVMDDGRVYPRYYPEKGSNDTVLVLEPSNLTRTKVFMQMTDEKKKKISRKVNYDMQSVSFTSNWSEDLSVKNINHVLINWSISELMYSPASLVKNLLTLTTHSKECTVLVLFVDGDRVEELIHSENGSRYEIFDSNKKPIVGVYSYDDVSNVDGQTDSTFVLYVRETLRFGSGSVERVLNVNNIASIMSVGEFELIDTQPFDSYIKAQIGTDLLPVTIPNEIHETVLTTLSMFRYAVFKKTTQILT